VVLILVHSRVTKIKVLSGQTCKKWPHYAYLRSWQGHTRRKPGTQNHRSKGQKP